MTDTCLSETTPGREREARRIVCEGERAGGIEVAQGHCCREVHLRLR